MNEEHIAQLGYLAAKADLDAAELISAMSDPKPARCPLAVIELRLKAENYRQQQHKAMQGSHDEEKGLSVTGEGKSEVWLAGFMESMQIGRSVRSAISHADDAERMALEEPPIQ